MSSGLVLETLDEKDRIQLIVDLLQKQVIDQRHQLNYYKVITGQPAQIDTGYIGQHLISLITKIRGGGFRGKGLDLADGSEVKSANFLDSLDKKGAVAPRWNFQANDLESVESFLQYPAIYLVSIDLTPDNRTRIRAWKVDVQKHHELKERYLEWVEVLAKPKLFNPNRPGVNFQLFPPRTRTNENFARHGNGRSNGFSKLEIQLENHEASRLIFHAEEIEYENNEKAINILHIEI